jgi:hypothetical protein
MAKSREIQSIFSERTGDFVDIFFAHQVQEYSPRDSRAHRVARMARKEGISQLTPGDRNGLACDLWGLIREVSPEFVERLR